MKQKIKSHERVFQICFGNNVRRVYCKAPKRIDEKLLGILKAKCLRTLDQNASTLEQIVKHIRSKCQIVLMKIVKRIRSQC